MNLLSNFIVSSIVKSLESQFVSHVPELQQTFLNEVSSLVKIVSDWVDSKVNLEGVNSNEKAS